MESLQNGLRAAIPEELPCRPYPSNHWNVKTRQNNLWTGLKAVLYSMHVIIPLIFLMNTPCFYLLIRTLFGLLPASVLPQ